MGEVDEFENPIHHGVAKGDGRVDKADGQSVDDDLRQVDHRIGEEGDAILFHYVRTDVRLIQDQGEDNGNDRHADCTSYREGQHLTYRPD